MAGPKIVSTRPEILAVDGNDLGVIPTDTLAPTAHPELDFVTRIRWQIPGQLRNQLRAIHRGCDYVAKHHAHNYFVIQDRVFLAECPEPVFEGIQKQPIGRRERQYVAPFFRSRNEFLNFFREPVVVAFPWIVLTAAGKGIPRCAVQLDNLPVCHVPQFVVVVVVVSSKDVVGRGSDVGKGVGTLVLAFVTGRLVEAHFLAKFTKQPHGVVCGSYLVVVWIG
mmetsp:Transcript_11626/g.24545  ORF Transcript_11626/g.24545 Transcript_11626/m.24545 type:complete len:222 (+) Transcript_11626:17-682(+)